MKKNTLLICLFTFFMLFNGKAAQINQETALKIAGNYLETKGKLKTSSSYNLTPVYTSVMDINLKSSANQHTVYYYVFDINEDNGFIIISGDDVARPVLGYSDMGKYTMDNQPPAFTYWMEYLKEEIQYAIQNQCEPGETTKAEWEAYSTGNFIPRQITAVEPLVKTLWNQDTPYNNLCPAINGQKTVTGCVATAMAIIMKYHNHPAKGTGSSTAYTTGTGINIPAVSFETDYLWDKMEDIYLYNSTDPDDAVATLMYHCGVSVRMNYDLGANGGSGAITRNVARVLPLNFGYDKGIQTSERRYYTDEEWKGILKEEIDNERPVLYSGRGGGAGHAFVCDGYDDSGKFHFNWGWGGMFNGYFVTNALAPGMGGIGSGAGSFNESQALIINIKPDEGGAVSTPEIKIWPARPISSTSASVDRGEVFTVTVPVINTGITDFVGYLAIARVDENDNIQEVIGQRADLLTINGIGNPYGYPVSCKFPATTPAGNHTLRAIAKTEDGEWSILKGEVGATTDKVEIEVKEGITYHGLKLINVRPLSSSSYTVGRGEYFDIRFAIRNSYPDIFNGNLGVGIMDKDDKVLNIIGKRERSISGQGYYLEGTITCVIPEEFEPGTYKLRVTAVPDGQDSWTVVKGLTTLVQDSLEITVTEQIVADESNLVLFNYDSKPGLNIGSSPLRQKEAIKVEAGVLNQGETFNGELELGIYSANDELIQLIEKKYISVNKGVGVSLEFSNEELTTSGTYKLRLYSKPAVGERKLVSNFMSFENDIDITIEPAGTTSTYDADTPVLSIYPNPVKDILNIINPEDFIQRIVIYTNKGVLQEVIDINQEDKQIYISLSDLSAGMYILVFETQESRYRFKIIKE